MVHQAILTVNKTVNKKQLNDNASLTQDLGFDSMGLVTLASELEKQFKHSLPLSEWVEQNQDKKLLLGSLIQFLTDK